LPHLTQLSDAAAESLSKYEDDLYLEGLTELSDATAESLSKHQGDLWFNSLAKLSDAAAESLCKHQGKINQRVPKKWVEISLATDDEDDC
jgi:hypothetical protein